MSEIGLYVITVRRDYPGTLFFTDYLEAGNKMFYTAKLQLLLTLKPSLQLHPKESVLDFTNVFW